MSYFKTKLRRVRFWWRLFLAYTRRYKWYFLVSPLVLGASAYFLIAVFPRMSQTNTINIGYVGNYDLKSLPAEALELATKTLVSVDESGRPQPSLASHWTVSDDGKTYVVFLKDNLVWHDGSQVDAKDISIAITNVQINALNNKAIEFKLPNPISSFLLALNKPVFKSKSFYGTSNYRITDIDEVEGQVKQISLVPSDKKLPKVNVKFYPSEVQALTAFKIGDIKYGAFNNASELEKWPNVDFNKRINNDEIVTIFFNTDDRYLGKEMRQALIYCINRTEFAEALAQSPISPNNWAYFPVKKYEYNTGKARELISKSNYDGEEITLSYIQAYEQLAKKIQADWEAVGVKVKLKEENQVPSNFQAFLTVNKLSPDPDQYALWHSSQQQTNLTKFKNVKIDKLLEDARSASDEGKRKELYADFQRFLVEDAPAAFLYHPYKYELTYKNIKNLLSKLPQN